ncbi:hypothetical protein EDC01DRAFT_780098 [Geopyxis carbonaria]|nr:hypothetical protein EDC01DRAFT_780098 [Geopyxis carbonaria]
MPRRGSIDQGPVRKNVSERLRSASAYTRSSETLFQTASHSPRPRNVSLAGTTSTGATAIPPPVDGEDPTQPQTIAWKNLDSLRAEYAAADRRHKSPWGWIRRRILCGAGLLGCGGNQAEFWEEGDEDRGSVRRYRLALPSEGNVGEVVRMVGEDRVEKVPVGWVRGVEREKGG